MASATSSAPSPAALDYNLYYSTVGAASSLWDWQGKSITGYTNYRSASGMDAHSPFADPQFLNISSPPPNLDVLSSSPAMNAGANLGSSVVGLLDYCGEFARQCQRTNKHRRLREVGHAE